MDLYSDNNPSTTIKGFGFKDEKTAKETINKLKEGYKKGLFNKTYIKQIIITMYYRAKHHPYRTKNMEKAMKIFDDFNKKLKLNIKLQN
jgi:hypothetical protein